MRTLLLLTLLGGALPGQAPIPDSRGHGARWSGAILDIRWVSPWHH